MIITINAIKNYSTATYQGVKNYANRVQGWLSTHRTITDGTIYSLVATGTFFLHSQALSECFSNNHAICPPASILKVYGLVVTSFISNALSNKPEFNLALLMNTTQICSGLLYLGLPENRFFSSASEPVSQIMHIQGGENLDLSQETAVSDVPLILAFPLTAFFANFMIFLINRPQKDEMSLFFTNIQTISYEWVNSWISKGYFSKEDIEAFSDKIVQILPRLFLFRYLLHCSEKEINQFACLLKKQNLKFPDLISLKKDLSKISLNQFEDALVKSGEHLSADENDIYKTFTTLSHLFVHKMAFLKKIQEISQEHLNSNNRTDSLPISPFISNSVE